MSQYQALAQRVLDGIPIDRVTALAILDAPDVDTLDIVAAAARVRREHFGNRVKLNYLVNLKSGLCQENCNYCSQSIESTAPILKYSWLDADEAVRQAALGVAGGAARVCLVASGRGPLARDIDRVSTIASTFK